MVLVLLSCAHRPRSHQYAKGTYTEERTRSSEKTERPSREIKKVSVKPERASGNAMDGPETFKR